MVNKKGQELKIFSLILLFLLGSIANVTASILEDASKYAVRIKTSISYPFFEDRAGVSNGAGFLVDKDRGWIVTNAHVSGRGTGTVEVLFKDNDFQEAEIVYVDPELDFSILNVEDIPDSALVAKLDCQTRKLNGLEVAAFGHPHSLYFSASRGIVSKVRFYEGHDWVQTDAAINPGNSGGPLISLDTGLIIGINAMSLKDSEGLNFAVPMAPVCKSLELLRNDLNPSPPLLPLSFASDSVAENYLIVAGNRLGKLSEEIQIGDEVTAVNGIQVSSPTELATELRGKSGKAKFTFKRGGKEVNGTIEFSPKPRITERQYLMVDGGLIAEDIYPERFALEKNYMFHSVRKGSYAQRVGFGKGEIVLTIDGVKPTSIGHLEELLSGENEKEVITRHWSSIDELFYDYYKIDYEPGFVRSYNIP